MAISKQIKGWMKQSSWIRKMFEEGAVLKARYGEENVYDFSLGNPDLEPPIIFSEKLKNIADERQTGKHGYMPNAGYPETAHWTKLCDWM